MNTLTFLLAVACSVPVLAGEPEAALWALDESPAQPAEWGFRPVDGADSAVNPPAFVWRPQKRAHRYQLQISGDERFQVIEYQAHDLELYCHCPPRKIAPGRWYWRFRASDDSGQVSVWSTTRVFRVPADAVEMPMPARADLRSRLPRTHPRLMLRPEDLPKLRERCRTDLADHYQAMVKRCEAWLKAPPSSDEPKKYPDSMVRRSEAWREQWWGNRLLTIDVLEPAATLAFVHRLNDNEQYGQLARRLLMEVARWDPVGATGFRYNDEAGMPYAYLFSRTYSFLYDLLSEQEREQCRKVMRVRGREMYEYLYPRHIWTPYNSHNNRAWHFLGEVGVAFFDEIPEAEDWLWYAMNIFYSAYPVWCDDDGGWHEGLAYWQSYMSRFSWWADVMHAAFDLDAFRKPYFSQIGYYPLYLQPPGTVGGGFGDLTGRLKSISNVSLMRQFAARGGNPYWQWYVQAHESPSARKKLAEDLDSPFTERGAYTDFLRGSLGPVQPKAPTDLPTSRVFRGIGQAFLNTTLLDASQNVQLLFKSSPFGSMSHGYDANNAFLLTVFGRPMFISSGERDIYGSEHHSKWMWHTKSTNCITVNGESQIAHSVQGAGRITQFKTTPKIDYVAGEAGSSYGDKLNRFTRRILFVKPDLIVIHDLLEAKGPSTFEWRLHSPKPMRIESNQRVQAVNSEAQCEVAFLEPRGLEIEQTDRFDPPPRPRIKLTEYHLTASTTKPAERTEFVTVLRPHHIGTAAVGGEALRAIPEGWALEAELASGKMIILLRREPGGALTSGAFKTDADVAAVRVDASGKPVSTFEAENAPLKPLLIAVAQR